MSDFNTVTYLRKDNRKKPSNAHAVAKGKAAGTLGTEKREVYRETAVYARKLDDETEDFRHAKVGTDFKKALMQARQKKNMTQAQLAQQCGVKSSVINQYEQGKVVPEQALISKMNRVLGTKLPKIQKPKKDKKPRD